MVKSISSNDDIKSLHGTVEGKNLSSRGVVFVNNNQIRGINVVSADLHAVNKRQLDNKLSIDGSSVMDGDLKMGGNNILNIRSLSDHKDDDPYERRERDLYIVVNKEYLTNETLMIMILICVVMLSEIANLIIMAFLEVLIWSVKLL